MEDRFSKIGCVFRLQNDKVRLNHGDYQYWKCYLELIWIRLFQQCNEEDRDALEYPDDENRERRIQAIFSRRKLWQVLPIPPPFEKFACRAVWEPVLQAVTIESDQRKHHI